MRAADIAATRVIDPARSKRPGRPGARSAKRTVVRRRPDGGGPARADGGRRSTKGDCPVWIFLLSPFVPHTGCAYHTIVRVWVNTR